MPLGFFEFPLKLDLSQENSKQASVKSIVKDSFRPTNSFTVLVHFFIDTCFDLWYWYKAPRPYDHFVLFIYLFYSFISI